MKLEIEVDDNLVNSFKKLIEDGFAGINTTEFEWLDECHIDINGESFKKELVELVEGLIYDGERYRALFNGINDLVDSIESLDINKIYSENY